MVHHKIYTSANLINVIKYCLTSISWTITWGPTRKRNHTPAWKDAAEALAKLETEISMPRIAYSE